MICADKTIAGIVNNQEVIIPSMLNELCHLHSELDAWVGTTRDAPLLSMIIESLTKELSKLHHVWLYAWIILPSQEKNGNIFVDGFIGSCIDKGCRILKMSGKGLEVGALGRWCRILNERN